MNFFDRPSRADDIWAAYDSKAPEPEDRQTPVNLKVVNPADLAFRPIPPREWIVEDWLPVGCVTANYGDGGTGKTLIAQQLMTSTALGGFWCGREVMRCRSFGLFCEDDEAELHRRQYAICASYGASMSDLEPMRWVSGVGDDNALMAFDNDGGYPTPMYEAIKNAAINHGAQLIVLDTAADLFAGNENDRHQVRRFIGQLNRLAIDVGGAVLLNAHPSRTGLSTGNLDGGSTAWSNSVRSRWSLARPPSANGDQEDPDARILTRRKANYARIGEDIALRWQDGVFVPPRSFTDVNAGSRKDQAEMAFIEALRAWRCRGLHVSNSSRAHNYAPKVLKTTPQGRDFSVPDLKLAMDNMLSRGRLQVATYRHDSKTHDEIVEPEVGRPPGS